MRCYAHGMRFSSSLFVDHSAATGHRLSIRLEPSADSDASENYLITGENSAFSDLFRSINQQNDRAIVGTALLSAYIKVNTPHFAGIVRLNSEELSNLSNHRVQ
jgi:hypothetical protein